MVSSFYLESYKDGTCYKCIWYKDEAGQPVLSIYETSVTSEPNGVKYIISIKETDIAAFSMAAFIQLFAFTLKPEFYSDINDLTTKYDFFNKKIITTTAYDGIEIYTLDRDCPHIYRYSIQKIYVRIGPVVYPINQTVFSRIRSYRKFCNFNDSGSIPVIDIPIGLLEIPMSREAVLDTEDNNNKLIPIIDRVLEATTAKICEAFFNTAKPDIANKSVDLLDFITAYKAGMIDNNPILDYTTLYHPLENYSLVVPKALDYSISSRLPSDFVYTPSMPVLNAYSNNLLLVIQAIYPYIVNKVISRRSFLFNNTPIYNQKGILTAERSRHNLYKTIYDNMGFKEKRLVVLQDTSNFQLKRVQAYLDLDSNKDSNGDSIYSNKIVKVTLSDIPDNSFDILIDFHNELNKVLDLDIVFIKASSLPKLARVTSTATTTAARVGPSYYTGIRALPLQSYLDYSSSYAKTIEKTYDGAGKLELLTGKHLLEYGTNFLVLNKDEVNQYNIHHQSVAKYLNINHAIIATSTVYDNVVKQLKTSSILNVYEISDFGSLTVDLNTALDIGKIRDYNNCLSFVNKLTSTLFSSINDLTAYKQFIISFFETIPETHKYYSLLNNYIKYVKTSSIALSATREIKPSIGYSYSYFEHVLTLDEFNILNVSQFSQSLNLTATVDTSAIDITSILNEISLDLFNQHYEFIDKNLNQNFKKELILNLLKQGNNNA